MRTIISKISKLFVPLVMLLVLWLVFTRFMPLVLQVVGIGIILILLMALLSPFESLGWWAGWFGRPHMQDEASSQDHPGIASEVSDHYLVYLSGIGALSGMTLTGGEVGLLEQLSKSLPRAVIITDVFPYAMSNNGLTGQRFFSWLWRWLQQRSLSGKVGFTNALACLRNVFQVAVSADRRYGPIYNYGIAEVICRHLLRSGYRKGCGKPVMLIGFSGGGQVALGACWYLKSMLDAPLSLISIGGVMADDPGIANVEHLSHLYGTKDPVQMIGAICYAGRWPLLSYTPWNQAKAAGKITMTAIGPMTHMDPHSYFDGSSYLENGESHQTYLAELITQLVQTQPEKPAK